MRKKTKQIKPQKSIILTWLPRVLASIFILLLVLFSLDVFGAYTFPEVVIAFIIHLIPAIFVTLGFVVGWIWPMWGGLYFFSLAAADIILEWGSPISYFLIIVLPLAVIGALFLADYFVNRKE
jgi:hypothetical protein